jgi:hypothetical protein
MAVDMRILKKLKLREKELDYQLREMDKSSKGGSSAVASTHRSGIVRNPIKARNYDSEMRSQKLIQDPRKTMSGGHRDYNYVMQDSSADSFKK